MSLILDALKKSEAERRRGMPPTLHMPFGTPRRARRMPWAAGAGAVLLAAGLAGGWMWMGRARDAGEVGVAPMPPLAGVSGSAPGDGSAALAAAPASDPMAAAAAPAAPEAPAAFSTHVAESAFGGVSGNDAGVSVSGGGLPVPQRAALYTPSAVPVAPPTTVATTPETPTVAPPEPPAPPVSVPVAEASDPDSSQQPASADALPVAAAAESGQPPEMPAPSVAMVEPLVTAPAKPEEKLPDVYQLPYATRKELPKLNLTMHVYSPIAEERFIVLNGKRYTLQSPAPGPELSLLDIVADGAVLEFRGQRFLLPRQTF